MLQTRIRFVANLINDKDLVVDVGSDHALLSKVLIDEKRSLKVINLEKNLLPLNVSIEATKNYDEKIENLKSDGLKKIEPSLLINICTIMGMGGKTIIEILDNATNKNVEQYILQPNNNEKDIRIWARKNNWKISFEEFIEENNVIYEIIVLNKNNGYIAQDEQQLFFGKINLEKKQFLFFKKWKNYLIKISRNDILKFNKNKQEQYQMIKKVLENENH